jgi:hypothetical protein
MNSTAVPTNCDTFEVKRMESDVKGYNSTNSTNMNLLF